MINKLQPSPQDGSIKIYIDSSSNGWSLRVYRIKSLTYNTFINTIGNESLVELEHYEFFIDFDLLINSVKNYITYDSNN